MNRKYRFYIFTAVFLISLILVFCLGYFRESKTTESGMSGNSTCMTGCGCGK